MQAHQKTSRGNPDTNIAARSIKLHELRDRFGLVRVEDPSFFREWVEDLPELTDQDRERLDRVKRHYLYLMEYPLVESIIKLVVLSPLLDLAGYYEPPFRVEGEAPVRVSAEDEGEIIQGNIDVLVVQGRIWVTVIEAKHSEFSLTKALPQALAYMLSTPDRDQPQFALILNGSGFWFLKLVWDHQVPQYGSSNVFSLLNQGNELYRVLQVLKRLGRSVTTPI